MAPCLAWPSGGPRSGRREHTRNLLLDAAEEVFAAKGFEGASLDEIAETAGYTRGAIYKHFAQKEELFLEVNRRHNEQFLTGFLDLIDTVGPATGPRPRADREAVARAPAPGSRLPRLRHRVQPLRPAQPRGPGAGGRATAVDRRDDRRLHGGAGGPLRCRHAHPGPHPRPDRAGLRRRPRDGEPPRRRTRRTCTSRSWSCSCPPGRTSSGRRPGVTGVSSLRTGGSRWEHQGRGRRRGGGSRTGEGARVHAQSGRVTVTGEHRDDIVVTRGKQGRPRRPPTMSTSS